MDFIFQRIETNKVLEFLTTFSPMPKKGRNDHYSVHFSPVNEKD